jgi:ketosteroid isomerase-like protein
LIVGVASSAGAGEPKGGNDDTARTLQAIEQTWLNAEKNHDPASFERLVADDWIALTPDGKRQTKAERSAKIKNSHMGAASLGPMDVRVFGDTAVVTGTVDETAQNATHQYVWTDVFIKRRGQWLAVASQTALIK